MSHLTTTPNGTPVDLDTARGQYEYLGEFLASHGAPSTTLSLLTRLYTRAISADQPKPEVLVPAKGPVTHPKYTIHQTEQGGLTTKPVDQPGSDPAREDTYPPGSNITDIGGCDV